MTRARDLDAICSEIVARQWSARKVPFGVYADHSRGRVVLQTVQLREEEREALRVIGGDQIDVDETAHSERR